AFVADAGCRAWRHSTRARTFRRLRARSSCALLRAVPRDGTLVAMSRSERSPTPVRARREPPRFRRVTVRRVEHLSPRMLRVTFAGPHLEGLTVEHPAASVRL